MSTNNDKTICDKCRRAKRRCARRCRWWVLDAWLAKWASRDYVLMWVFLEMTLCAIVGTLLGVYHLATHWKTVGMCFVCRGSAGFVGGVSAIRRSVTLMRAYLVCLFIGFFATGFALYPLEKHFGKCHPPDGGCTTYEKYIFGTGASPTEDDFDMDNCERCVTLYSFYQTPEYLCTQELTQALVAVKAHSASSAAVAIPPPVPQGIPPPPPPVTQPGFPPVTSPGYPPVTQPGFPPVTSPGYPPVTSPDDPPVTSPGYPPVTSPGYPPGTSPGYPPAIPLATRPASFAAVAAWKRALDKSTRSASAAGVAASPTPTHDDVPIVPSLVNREREQREIKLVQAELAPLQVQDAAPTAMAQAAQNKSRCATAPDGVQSLQIPDKGDMNNSLSTAYFKRPSSPAAWSLMDFSQMDPDSTPSMKELSSWHTSDKCDLVVFVSAFCVIIMNLLAPFLAWIIFKFTGAGCSDFTLLEAKFEAYDSDDESSSLTDEFEEHSVDGDAPASNERPSGVVA